NNFSFRGTIPSGLTPGTVSVRANITDAQLRSGVTLFIQISVAVPTPPTGTGSATPPTVAPGGRATLTVNVTPGTNPASTGITVTGDLTAIGIAGPQAFQSNGANAFSYVATTAPATSDGSKALTITVADGEGRHT